MRRVAVYSVAALVILAGLAVAVASRLLPLVQSRPQQLAAWLSERSGQPVAFRFGAAEWTRRGPVFTLDGLSVGAGEGALDIGRAELLLDVYAGLLPGRPLTELRLRGAVVKLQRGADGRWQVIGGSSGAGAGQRLRQIEGLGEIQLENARVQVADLASGRSFSVDRVDVRVRSVGGRIRIGASAWRGEGAPLTLAAEFDAGLQDGRGHLGGRDLSLGPWSAGLDWAGVALHQGSGDVDAWFEVRDRRIVQVQAEVELESLGLRGLHTVAAGASSIEPRLGIDALGLSARWRSGANGWELSVPRLLVDDGGERAEASGLLLVRDGGWRAQAGRLELAAPLALAMLSDRVPAPLRRWLYLASPHGRIDDLRLLCAEGQGCSGHAGLAGLRWRPAGTVPGLRGLGGRLDFGADALLLDLDGSLLRVDAPRVFRAPILATVDGRVWASREGSGDAAGWQLGSDALAIGGSDFAAHAAGALAFADGGGRPRLDLFAEVAPTSVRAARRFWVPGKMSPKVIDWLDTALVSGRVTGGRLVLRGDLDDWPFRANEGVFDAEVGLSGLVLDYRPGEWPRGEGLEGVARFVNAGMEATASGTVAGVEVERVDARIDAFGAPVLELEIAGSGEGAALLGLLRSSPLQRRFGSQLIGLGVGGSAQVQVGIVVPLKKELGEPAVQGTADLVDADLRDAKWGLAFDGAAGRVRFGDRGFAAEELRVRYEGQPATLSIAIGEYTSSEALAAEATLRGRFEVDSLLGAVPALDWLAPYVTGTSDWSLLLTVPEADGSLRSLRARSDLVGTTLGFPAPLRKHADASMPLRLQAQLPLAEGGIELDLGQLLHLQGRFPATGGFTGVAAFGEVERVAVPDAGLRVTGSVPVLDAAGWIGVAAAGGLAGNAGEAAKTPLLADLDVSAGELDVLGRAFAETRLRLDEVNGDTRIRVSGGQLEGSVLVPGGDGGDRDITARFERLYLPASRDDGPEPAAALLGGFSPAAVPPLHLWAGDLRVGEAELGEARLETWPTPAGLHVQTFESHSPDMELHASGDWLRVDGRERSAFQIGFTAEDLGRMLGALGFAGIVEGGQTLARLEATWPGAPTAFELGRLDGRLEISVGQGSVPNVEPGAGRILGLLSLSEIPRRLSLDFSDFFNEGFSFNTIRGEFVLDGGSAYTDDLVIDGASAEIRVRGRTGLQQQTYDQTMEVLPRTSGVLPVVGALAAGPAGAAIGAVAQAVLQRPMKQMTRVLYHVGGSWDAPKIEVVERGAARKD